MQTNLFGGADAIRIEGKFVTPNTLQELSAFFWGNGGNQPPTVQFHEDSGHGWLQIPHSIVKQMGIEDKISQFSYRDAKYAYLEEDCDFALVIEALKIPERNWQRDFWKLCPRENTEYSPIRDKKHYK